MINQKELSKLKVNDKVEHFLLISSISIKTTINGKNYLDLALRDKSNVLNAKLWDNVESIAESASVGKVVKVLGVITEYKNLPQIKIEKIRLANDKDNVEPSDFLPRSKRSLNEMENEFRDVVKNITNQYLKKLLLQILTTENFDKYKRVPAGKAWHHAYISGLLEHTIEIIKICELMCSIHPELNKDLLLTGAILHDFGKIEELSFDSAFEYTDKGKLLGHIVIVANLIEKEVNKIKDFPESLKNQLLHLVLSHQGKLEYASPVIPKTLEAIVLYHADELSAKANAYKNAIISEIDLDKSWTKYQQLAGTDVYIDSFRGEDSNFKETFF